METATEPINAGLAARWLTIFAFKLRYQKYLRRVWKPSPGLLSMFGVCIKAKPFEHLAEAHTMQFIARHTSIPVPKLYCAFIHKGDTYIVMRRIKGQMAWHGWRDRSRESKKRILHQLRRMISELRSIDPPEGVGVAGVDGGPFCDCRLPCKLFWGPFATTRDFHRALANNADPEADYENLPPDLPELLSFYRQPFGKSVLTHGDLSSLNILVNWDEVVGIIDWETSGWFPPYWEYSCAKNVTNNVFSEEEMDMFLDPMPHELAMEGIRRRYFDF
ncbi:hypothetical protein TOPH_09114 [Tolypocladium ophioglossoides CBS 100239]|uniref:Aminoglycoside phosphotransferase domain-containing protein n=1 Tax=Tolypocladium ophioglossoides (strain CBS 100239) TaxID=1163406 RepID=A0A0L0MWU5_TOLOC|nr:hypothetical protein TOPH_09114 [Tolypocladium ophioglossoides CBS 100239]